MATLRVICVECDQGAACNVGGPVEVRRKTFDVPCTPELEKWITEIIGDQRFKYTTRFIEGIEVR